jgi:predicted MPP superfamily phosphohydrolase
LLAHNPKYFKSYAAWGADLTLSGHIHGGIVQIPFLGGAVSPQVEFFPKYDAGLFHENDKAMILSRGLGTHTINVRINNTAELVSIKLKA